MSRPAWLEDRTIWAKSPGRSMQTRVVGQAPLRIFIDRFSEGRFMRAHRIVTCLLVSLLTAATAAKAEDPVNIPDPALKAAIEAALGIPNPTPTDMLRLTEFNASAKGIADLTGLEYVGNLTGLDLSANNLTDIGPLAGLTSLTWLYLQNPTYEKGPNQIRDLNPLKGLVNLTQLNLEGNHVTNVSALSGLTRLTWLNLRYNDISDISALAGLQSLTTLSLLDNQVVDVRPLKDLTNLHALGLDNNPISDIAPLSGLTALKELGLTHTLVTDIGAVASLKNLEAFGAGWAHVTDLGPLSGLTNLRSLYFYSSDSVRDISPLAGLTKLEWLELFQNHVEDISPLAGLTNLRVLGLTYNEITDISVLSGLPRLVELGLGRNSITDLRPLAGLSGLTYLDLDSDLITDISPLAGLGNLTYLRLDNTYPPNSNGIADISALLGMTWLQELWLSGNPLHPKVCVVDIPLIKANNPGIVVRYDGCMELPQMLTVSSAPGGSVVMPGEDAFTYPWGTLVPVEAVANEGYQFMHWSGTAADPNVMLDPCAPHTSVFMDADYSLVAHFKPQNQPWSTVYFNDFEDKVGPEWSRGITDITPVGGRQFLGRFHTDSVTLALEDLPPHSQVRVSFDLFVIHSWDGDTLPGVHSPDMWTLDVNDGPTLLQTTFDNHITPPYSDSHVQSYPREYPYGESLPQTGAAETSTLGYVFRVSEPMDSVYHLTREFAHADRSVQLIYRAQLMHRGLLTSDVNDESWGLDNVRVEVLAPVSEVALTVSSTDGGAVTSPGEGQFNYLPGTIVPVEALAEAGYHFTSWSGSAVDANKISDPASANTTVVADGDYTLVANFAVNQKTLTVSAGTGGNVTAPGEGSFQCAQGASVSIQAAAKAHYYFTHWSGTAVDAGKVADPASAGTSVTMDADYTLAANFRIDQHRLTVSAAAGGYIYVETRVGNMTTPWYDGPIPRLDHGTEVTIIATPYGGWKFTGWGGTMGSTESPFTFQLTQDCDLEALFVPE